MKQAVLFFLAGFSWHAYAGTTPETNTLQAELRLLPGTPVPQNFGQLLSACSNVFVVASSKPKFTQDTAELATVFTKPDTGLFTRQTLAVSSAFSIQSINALAADPSRIAIAAADPFGFALYLFQLEQSDWAFKTNLIPQSTSQNITTLAASSRFLAAGTPGRVSVFELVTNGWKETAILPPASAASIVQANFGRSVALSDGTLIVGATGEIRSDAGHCYIYTNSTGSWILEAELSPEPFHFIPFGYAVALDGDTAVVSAFPGRFNEGECYVFSRRAGQWVQKAILSSGESQDFFGLSLSINGRNIVIGAPTSTAGRGAAWLFRENIGHWDRLRLFSEEMQPTNPMNGTPGDELGYAVAVFDNRILLGAPFHDGFGNDAGVAFVFNFSFDPFLYPPVLDAGFLSITVVDVVAGRTNILETTPTLNGSWISLKQFVPSSSDHALQLDATDQRSGFFRVVVPANQSIAGNLIYPR